MRSTDRSPWSCCRHGQCSISEDAHPMTLVTRLSCLLLLVSVFVSPYQTSALRRTALVFGRLLTQQWHIIVPASPSGVETALSQSYGLHVGLVREQISDCSIVRCPGESAHPCPCSTIAVGSMSFASIQHSFVRACGRHDWDGGSKWQIQLDWEMRRERETTNRVL